MYSKSAYYNINKQAEQKIFHLEEILKEMNTRLKENENQLINKETELLEALNRIRDYESGDYQLQQAVNEIKQLKNQIKIRDRDLNKRLNQLNKLDEMLNTILEENDMLRAKLNMEPREKIDIEELKDLKFNRDQENRAENYMLQRENEKLYEDLLKLRKKMRLLAKQVRSPGVLENIFSDDYNDFEYDSIGKNSNQLEKKEPKDEIKVYDMNNLIKRNEIQLQHLLELQRENEMLKKSLEEINSEIKTFGISKSKSKEFLIKCPSLEKLLDEMETNKAFRSNIKSYDFLNKILADSNCDSITLALKSELDFLQGRNEELRSEIVQIKSELKKTQISLIKSQEECFKLNEEVNVMNSNSAAKEIFKPFRLPPDMTPSSQDIISALNEYLIDTLQVRKTIFFIVLK